MQRSNSSPWRPSVLWNVTQDPGISEPLWTR